MWISQLQLASDGVAGMSVGRSVCITTVMLWVWKAIMNSLQLAFWGNNRKIELTGKGI